MTKTTLFTLAFMFVCAGGIYAQAQDQKVPERTPPTYPNSTERTITAHPDETNPVKGIDKTEKTFMQKAALGNLEEIQLGQLAEQKAASPSVKSFGQRMVKDHSNADNKLNAIAQSQQISLPVALEAKQKNEIDALSALSGKKFDQAYMTYMVSEHTKDVNEFKQEAANGQDPTLKQFAASSLPLLESHLKEAQQVDQQLKTQ